MTTDLIARRLGDTLEHHHSGPLRAVLVEVLDHSIRDRILDSGDKHIGLGFDKPEFHSAPHGWRQIIG